MSNNGEKSTTGSRRGRKKIEDRTTIRKPVTLSLNVNEEEAVREYIKKYRDYDGHITVRKIWSSVEVPKPPVKPMPPGAIAKNKDGRYWIEGSIGDHLRIHFPEDPAFNAKIKKIGASWNRSHYAWEITWTSKDAIKEAMRSYFGRDDEYIYDELIEVKIEVLEDLKYPKAEYDYKPAYFLGRFLTRGKKDNEDNVKIADDAKIIDGDIFIDKDCFIIEAGTKFTIKDIKREEYDKYIKKISKKPSDIKYKVTIIEADDSIESLNAEKEQLMRRLDEIEKKLAEAEE